jgi:magnesium-transporting ATPase (P-type)
VTAKFEPNIFQNLSRKVFLKTSQKRIPDPYFKAIFLSSNVKISYFFRFVRESYRSLESGLTLLGATGIEDKLQVCG